MIEVLLRHPGHLVPREQLLEEIWGEKGKRNPNYLRVFVARIRQKLEPDPAHPRNLLIVTGLGLVFESGGSRLSVPVLTSRDSEES
jgi:two-component system, OmpR family, KDP operon response regulator KdpE